MTATTARGETASIDAAPDRSGSAQSGSSQGNPELLRWLDAFATMRNKSASLVNSFVSRLSDEMGLPPVPATVASSMKASPGARRILSALSSAVRQRMRGAPDGSPACRVVALSPSRLNLGDCHDVRARLHELLRALPKAQDRDAIAAEFAAGQLILCDPSPISVLWLHADRLATQNVIVFDLLFASVVLLRSPRHAIRAIVRTLRILRTSQPSAHSATTVFVAAVIQEAMNFVSDRVGRYRVFLLTSNSFVTEASRDYHLRDARCELVSEVMHGIGSLEFEEYANTIISRSAVRPTVSFVPLLPGLPRFAGVAPHFASDPAFAINTTLNRYFTALGSAEDVSDRIDEEAKRLVASLPASDSETHLVAFIGASSIERSFLHSAAFRLERALMESILSILRNLGRPFAILYAPHPLHDVAAIRAHPFFAQPELRVQTDTVFSWLVADQCVGLYSGALFEAQFAGADVFTPLRHDDNVFSHGLLDTLTHPATGESCATKLAAFLQGGGPTTRADVRIRAQSRLAKIAPVAGQSVA